MGEKIRYIANEIKYGTFATYGLIALNVAVFIFVFIISNIFSGVTKTDLAQIFGGSAAYLVLNNLEWWRLVTSTFLHVDWWHILLNMVALYSIGRFVENYYSSRKVFIVYVLTGIAGSALAMFDQNAITLGASGAIFGFMGLIVGNLLKANTYSPGLPVPLNSILTPALFWLVLSFGIGGISFLGHLGGFLAGIVLGLVIDTANNFEFNTLKNRIFNVLFIICLALALLSSILLFASIFLNN